MYQSYPYQNQNYGMNQFQPRQEIVKVNGRNGAEAFQIAPNSSVLLLDIENPIVYLKTSDGAGYSVVTPYAITPYVPEKPVDVKSLEQRIARIEEMLNESNNADA